MELNSTITQNVDALFSNLETFTQKEGVLGKPVTYGDKTFIPVISLALGYGGGNSAGKNQQNQTGTNQTAGMGHMGMDALGMGAKISTEAVVLIDKDNVSMMTLTAMGNAGQLINKIPQFLAGMNQNRQQGQQEQQWQQGQQNQSQGQQ